MDESAARGGVPALADFFAYLRRQGFRPGVADYARAQALVDFYLDARASKGDEGGGDADDLKTANDLKTLLAPVFAASREQQEQFYRAFDDYVGQFRHAPSSAASDDEPQDTPEVHGPTPRRPLRPVLFLLAGMVVGAALVVAWWAWFGARDKGANTAANTGGATNSNVSVSQDAGAVGNSAAAVARGEGAGTRRANANPVEPSAEHQELNPSAPAPGPTPAETSATPTPTPTPAAPQSPEPWVRPSTLYLLAIFVGLFLLWESYGRLRRKLVLHRQPARKPPAAWPVYVKESAPPVYNSDEFYTAARLLRRRQVGEHHRLDIGATLAATVAALGYPNLRYKPDSKVPEYLVLVERAAHRDHQARLFDELARALDEEGLFVTRLFFEGDPRVCCDEAGANCLLLSEMQSRYAGHRLLIFGDGERMIDPATGRLAAWAGMFSEWQERALLTPEAQWGLREQTLSERFVVLPATPDGLLALSDRFDALTTATPPTRTRASVPPADPEQLQDPDALRRHLGEETFRWLCACAMYPELQWDLTLRLGSLVGEGVVVERNLRRLVRLPWFRSGSMPDALRWQLINRLEPEAQREVRGVLVGLLEQSPPREGTIAADRHELELAVQSWLYHDDAESLKRLRRVTGKLPPGQLLQDRTLVRYLEGVPRPGLDLVLPRRLRKHFFRHGLPVFGLKTATRLALTALAFAVTWGTGVLPIIDRAPDAPKPEYAALTPTPTPTPTPPIYTQSFASTVPVEIPTFGVASPYPSTIEVSNMSGRVRNVSVRLNNVSHTLLADLTVVLVAPSGQNLVLLSRVPGSYRFLDTTLIFEEGAPQITNTVATSRRASYAPPDDSAPQVATSRRASYTPQSTNSYPYGTTGSGNTNPNTSNSNTGSAGKTIIPSGTYRPTGPKGGDSSIPGVTVSKATSFSVFRGGDANGTWKLYVYDHVNADSGRIAGGWSIDITTDLPQSSEEGAGHRARPGGGYGGEESSEPSAEIENVWLGDDVKRNGQTGMLIHVRFTAENLSGETCRAIAYFYFEDGRPLKDFNGQYKTFDGQVSVGEDFRPSSDYATYGDFTLFLPHDELHFTSSGTYDLKFYVTLWHGDESLAQSRYVSFTLNKP